MSAHASRGLVVVAGGGTGGHIYPGIAVARALQNRGYRVEWVGARGGLEEKIVTREGLPLHLINIGKLHASAGLAARVKTLFGLPLAFLQALLLCWRLKPLAVLGVGGFASGPFMFVAALLRRRTVIWEPNAHVGMANRLLSSVVDECLLVFEEAASGFRSSRVTRVGLPVRESIRPAERAPLVGRKLRVLVFGGSQGARPINKVVQAAVEAGGAWLEGVELVHQTGRYDFQDVKAAYDRLQHPNVSCFEYLHDMDARYAWADVVVCRSGASTVAEIAAAAKAAIFIPLPTAADDHQLKNARVLERAGAARVIEQKHFTPELFSSTMLQFQNDASAIEQLGKLARPFAVPGAADVIATRVIGEN